MAPQRVIKRIDNPRRTSETYRPGQNELARVFVPEGDDVPLIECTKSGDVITQIDVRCSCGQVTRLVCEYPERV